jgi:aspartyl-tRNA(Asn)/glutamyl-tRNA(Gln) amidotransferase subunit C
MIDRSDVEYIAELARLNVSETEKESFSRQLSAVLDYMEQLNRVDTDGIEPTCFVIPKHDPLRSDTRRESLPIDRVLQNGPSIKKNYFAIPKVIG